MKIKEFGSYFSFETRQEWLAGDHYDNPLFNENIALCISGRTAIYGILDLGITKYGWKRVYFPEYYCHEVVDFLQKLPLDICYYSYDPFSGNNIAFTFIDDNYSVIVNVDYFGIFKDQLSNIKNAILIDDITYSILSYTSSTAAYCFASLRKELPVPAGGFCFSPEGLELPRFLQSETGDLLVKNSLQAMVLKKDFLQGKSEDKEAFRALYATSETGFSQFNLKNGALPDEALKLLKRLKVSEIINKKHANIAFALNALTDSVLRFCVNKDSRSFGLVLCFKEKSMRDLCRQRLIDAKIYPAILWPGQRHKQSVKNADQMLFVHIDYRYNTDDISYICDLLETTFYEI